MSAHPTVDAAFILAADLLKLAGKTTPSPSIALMAFALATGSLISSEWKENAPDAREVFVGRLDKIIAGRSPDEN